MTGVSRLIRALGGGFNTEGHVGPQLGRRTLPLRLGAVVAVTVRWKTDAAVAMLGKSVGAQRKQAMFVVQEDDLNGEQTRSLLAMHLAGMHANSPPGAVFALDLSGLQRLEITVWTAWRGDRIASVGALKVLDDKTGEVKSMRTHPAFLRMGAGAAILEQIIASAGGRGLRRLSLETGSGPAFEAALALYRRRGFKNGGAFSDYRPSEFNQFLHLDL